MYISTYLKNVTYLFTVGIGIFINITKIIYGLHKNMKESSHGNVFLNALLKKSFNKSS